MKLALRSLALLLLVLGAGAHAESAWVVDRLKLGLHESESTDSPVLTLLDSGAAVEVLERKGELARVRTDSGTEGWVDASYLSDSRPAALLLGEVEAERLQALDELEAARAQVAELQAALASAGTPAMASAVQSQSEAAPVSTEALREMHRLVEENQRLRRELTLAEATAATQTMQVTPPGAANPPAVVASYPHYLLAVLDWAPWPWLLVGALLLLAFAGGALTSEMGVRRRHGGFRLRL